MEIREYTQEEWHNIVKNFGDLSLMQTWEFAEAKKKIGGWEVVRFVFREKENIIGAGQGIIRYVPLLKKGLVWINRAPLYRILGDIDDSQRLIEMIKEIRRYFVDEKKMYLRIVPTVLDEEKNRSLIEKQGFKICEPPQNWMSAVIDLTKSEEDLRKGFHSKWRRNLNRSERLGIVCESGVTESLLGEFLAEYRNLLKQKGFSTSVTPELIQVLQDFFPDDRKMWVFVAKQGTSKLGAVLIAKYGNTCMYLGGAVNDEGRKLEANYFLLWQAICQMKKSGFNWFDVGGGMDEKLTTPGILYFKQGLSGTPYKLVGEFESYKKNVLNNLIRWQIQKLR